MSKSEGCNDNAHKYKKWNNDMNIMDFVSQLNVSIKDTGWLGYAEGISKIFINGLNVTIEQRNWE